MTLAYDEIEDILNTYEKDAKAIKAEILKLCWWMRGGISYDDAMLLSEQERQLIGKIIEDNIETTKRSGLPFF